MAYCYFDGTLREEHEALLSIRNLGVHRAFGIFDLLRMRNHRYSFLDDHLERFARSQQFLALAKLIPETEIREALEALHARNGYGDAAFRLMLLADGDEQADALDPLFFIVHSDLSSHAPPSSAGVIMHPYVREYPEIKTTNYFTSNLLHRRRMQAGAIDVIYHHQGLVSEASRSNVFIVKDGELKTPATHILHGITRKQVLKLAPHVGSVVVTDVTVDDLHGADEVFICSTLKEICPIVEIDGRPVGNGKPGPLTQQVGRLFQQLLQD